MPTVKQWCEKWLADNQGQSRKARSLCDIYQGGSNLEVGAGGVCLAVATEWIKGGLEGDSSHLRKLLDKGQEPATRYFARRDVLIRLRQETMANKAGTELASVTKTIMQISAFRDTASPKEREQIDKDLDPILELIDNIRFTNFLWFLRPLCGLHTEVKELRTKGKLESWPTQMNLVFGEGYYLQILRGEKMGDLSGSHAVAYHVEEGRWRFLDANSCEWEFSSGVGMKKLVSDFFAAWYKGEYAYYDLYKVTPTH
jgi:hypothetical protein